MSHELPEEGADIAPEPSFTPELFLEWRSPREGRSNPERMDNPVWEWLIRSRASAYHANHRLGVPSSCDAGPGWCFDRFGQSSTKLPDGRVILMAGEHEDYYDPDFYIYNDVVVHHPDDRIEVFGYPRAIFPATDFHSATLVGNRIMMIGNLGYPADRQPGMTQVLTLDLATLAVARLETGGSPPGWIHGHTAVISDDGESILIRGGKLNHGAKQCSLVENIDDWRLNLADARWERLTDRCWPRWEVRREDRRMNHLWQMEMAVFEQRTGHIRTSGGDAENRLLTLSQELGAKPDLELYSQRYQPGLKSELLPYAEEEYNVHRIRIAGVVVRYVEESHGVQMTVEGDLPQTTLDALVRDLCVKLSALENAPCAATRL